MKLSRREAIRVSGTAVAGLSMGVSRSNDIVAQTVRQQEWPDHLVEGDLRQRADLPLNPDGSAPEYPPEAADEITGTIWRYTQGKPPEIEYDYRKMAIRLDSRGLARLGGTLRFSDLEGLPRRSYTTLLQCGAPQPTGIVKWTGVRFSDFAEMIEIQSPAHYCRVISHDGYWIDEDISTMMDPQVMLVWLMNDEAIPPINGAPLRLVIPFRYGARSIKAVSEITFGSPGLSMREPPSRG
jgi:DMSO/TMAO reductase YedYZ molybdopterin-dependent catalytic subunit|tara:strand:+ start:2232 stop:2948 length:717 start_codon:yes stop_codon:yes gene_type:complete